jgi:hypothetical protein
MDYTSATRALPFPHLPSPSPPGAKRRPFNFTGGAKRTPESHVEASRKTQPSRPPANRSGAKPSVPQHVTGAAFYTGAPITEQVFDAIGIKRDDHLKRRDT